MERQLEQCRALMKAEGLDALLLRTRANFAWVTDGRDNHIEIESATGVADIVIMADNVIVITTEIEARRIEEEEIRDLPFELVSVKWTDGIDLTLHEMLAGKRVGADVPFGFALNVSSELAKLRRQLGALQVGQYESLCQDAADVLESVSKVIRPGQTEFSISAQLMAGLAERGCTPHVVLVATDERILHYRHPIPTAKLLGKYAMMVVCARRHGLVANVTRFVHFGPLPEELVVNKEKCAYIDARMNVATRPGVRVNDVFQTAVEAYRTVGYPDDWRLLHQGGPTGYAAREYVATPESDEIIQVNDVYAWNPAIRGIKSEDTILVGSETNTFLTHTGNWPYIGVQHEGVTYQRPDILVR